MNDCVTKSFLRDSCINCALKHLGQAAVIYKETLKGYPTFPVFVRGHMAEAEDELVCDHNELAAMIRLERTKYEASPEYRPDFEGLIISIVNYQTNLSEKELENLGYDSSTIANIQAS